MMNWTLAIQNKIKAALLLAVIMFAVILTNLVERNNIGKISDTFSSIYQDRLIPAADIFYITENLYSKRLLMEQHLTAHTPADDTYLQARLHEHCYQIDSLLSEFEKTYLVSNESRLLMDVKDQLHQYAHIEDSVVWLLAQGDGGAAAQVYHQHGVASFKRAVSDLYALTHIQTKVGAELMKDSRGIASSSTLLASIEIILAIVIGVMIQSLIFTSRMIKHQPFHLN